MPFADLVQDDGFRTGLAIGAAAALLVLLAVVPARRMGWRRAEPVPLAGAAFVVAALLSVDDLARGAGVSDRLVAGVLLLVLAPLLARLGGFRPTMVASVVCAVPGAAVVAYAAALENDVGWVPPVVFAAIVICGPLVTDFDRANAPSGLGPVLLAAAVLAMYTAVPDTEEAAAIAGAALPIALLGAPYPVASLGAAGAPGAVGLVVWAAAIGGRDRPGSVVGAIACLGVMLVEPIVRRARPGMQCSSPRRPLSMRAALIVVLDLGVVAGTSRVAGLETSGGAALAISAFLLAVAAAVLVVLLRPWTRAEPDTPSAASRGDAPVPRRAPDRRATGPTRR